MSVIGNVSYLTKIKLTGILFSTPKKESSRCITKNMSSAFINNDLGRAFPREQNEAKNKILGPELKND